MAVGPQGQSLVEYLDAELAGFVDFDSVVTAGGSTFTQVEAAAFPERPGARNEGYRVTTTAGNNAYGQVDSVGSLSPGDAIYLGWWMRITDQPPATTYVNRLAIWSGGVWNTKLALYLYATGQIQLRYNNDGGAQYGSSSAAHTADTNGWFYIVIAMRRATTALASDGWARFYINGAAIDNITAVDNYDTLSGTLTLQAGVWAYQQNSFSVDLDEIMVVSAYPAPYVPAATSEYLEARRMVVCYRHASADSRTFARYCATALGIPRANLCPLPNASATESLADYATFQTQVETDLAAWLALNTDPAAQCCCLVLGYGVPQLFTHGGVLHSAASRLMKLGTAFSSQTANPFHGRTTRITAAELSAAGVFLTTTLDAYSLAYAQGYITKGLAVADAAEGEKLLASDAGVRASLAAQGTRLTRAATYTPGDSGAFMAGSLAAIKGADPYWPTAGTRAAVVATVVAQTTVRGVSSDLLAVLAQLGWAAGLGWSIANGGSLCDIESFLEILRAGGTFAAASLGSVAYLNYAAIPIGLPTMTLGFPLSGYNWYLGEGDVSAIDYTTPVAYSRAGDEAPALPLSLAEDIDYWLGVRAQSASGVEEANTDRVTRVRIHAGALVPLPPNNLNREDWSAEAAAAGAIRLRGRYVARGQLAAATGVQVARVTCGLADWDSLIETIAIVGAARIDAVLGTTFENGETVQLAVRAVTGEGAVGGDVFLNPVVADSEAPAAPTTVLAAQA